MFTGIVQTVGRIARVQRNAFGCRLVVDRGDWQPAGGYQPAHGDSICVSGVCLTVVEAKAQTLSFDVIAETLSRTTLGRLAVGDGVNLEPAVLPSQPLGGHFMQGHIDGVGEVTDVYDGSDEWRTTVKPPRELMAYIIPKGSIAIDGVSLTVAAVHADCFEVALIPTTLNLTTLAGREKGDAVNLEADIISKTVVYYLQQFGAGALQKGENLSFEKLRDAGFAQGGD